MNNFQKIYIAVLMATRWIIFGSAKKSIKEPKNILIIQLSQLGDMVCTTPMFRAVKNKYPGSKLVALGRAGNQELLRHNTDIDEYLPDNTSFSQMLKKIRSMQFDFACMTSPNFISLALMYLAGIPLITVPKIENGFSPYVTRLYRFFIHVAVIKPHRMRYYAPREYLRLLEPIGIETEDTTKHLGFSEEAKRSIDKFFIDHSIGTGDLVIGISPSAGNKIKLWRRDRFAQLADYLYETHGARIIVTGGKNDIGEVQEMTSCLKETTPTIMATHFNIDELKACISRLSLFISVDTGPIYIAEALNIPTIDITGPIDEKEQPPIGPFHIVVKPEKREAPQLFVMNARVYDPKEARRQVDSIEVKDVIIAADGLIEKIK